jgi:hypothetical protein
MNRRTFLSSLSMAAIEVRGGDAQPEVSSGWDWSLLAGIKPAPYSGFVTWGKSRFSELITMQGIMATWASLCPAPGEYNWQPLGDAMEQAKAAGMRVGLHIKISSSCNNVGNMKKPRGCGWVCTSRASSGRVCRSGEPQVRRAGA